MILPAISIKLCFIILCAKRTLLVSKLVSIYLVSATPLYI